MHSLEDQLKYVVYKFIVKDLSACHSYLNTISIAFHGCLVEGHPASFWRSNLRISFSVFDQQRHNICIIRWASPLLKQCSGSFKSIQLKENSFIQFFSTEEEWSKLEWSARLRESKGLEAVWQKLYHLKQERIY